jgi:hypothetical protein
MNRKQRRIDNKTNVPRCSSCGRRKAPQAKSIRDGKERCLVCHDLHMKSAADDDDPGNDLAARLQKGIQDAVLSIAGRDPANAPLIVAALGSLTATFAVQTELLQRAAAGSEDTPLPREIDIWEETYAARCRDFHRLVCQALQMRGDGPQHTRVGTVGFLRDQLDGLPAGANVVVGRLLSEDEMMDDEAAWGPVGGIRLGRLAEGPGPYRGGPDSFRPFVEDKSVDLLTAVVAIDAAGRGDL